MNVNVLFWHITLLNKTWAICITFEVVAKLLFGEATAAGQDARPTSLITGGYLDHHKNCGEIAF